MYLKNTFLDTNAHLLNHAFGDPKWEAYIVNMSTLFWQFPAIQSTDFTDLSLLTKYSSGYSY